MGEKTHMAEAPIPHLQYTTIDLYVQSFLTDIYEIHAHKFDTTTKRPINIDLFGSLFSSPYIEI